MYQQTLYKIIEPIKPYVIKRLNKSKKWKYGYNKEYDIIVISRTGQIGEIYEISHIKVQPDIWSQDILDFIYNHTKLQEFQSYRNEIGRLCHDYILEIGNLRFGVRQHILEDLSINGVDINSLIDIWLVMTGRLTVEDYSS